MIARQGRMKYFENYWKWVLRPIVIAMTIIIPVGLLLFCGYWISSFGSGAIKEIISGAFFSGCLLFSIWLMGMAISGEW